MADLGVSSHQFDEAERGFSIRFDGELDMRMNQSSKTSAKKIINTYTEEMLANILFMYGELRNARAIAHTIVEARTESARRKIARIQLNRMTDRELKDLGIGRHDIERAILYGKSI